MELGRKEPKAGRVLTKFGRKLIDLSTRYATVEDLL